MNANTAAPATRRTPITIATGLTAPRLKLPSSEANAGLFMASSGAEHTPDEPGWCAGLAARYRSARRARRQNARAATLALCVSPLHLGDDDDAHGARRGGRGGRARA